MRIAAMAAAVSTTSALRFVSGCGGTWLGWLGLATGAGKFGGASSGASTKATGLAVLGAVVAAAGEGAVEGAS